MALFRANSSNSKPNPKNFSWAIANEHASKALVRELARDDFLAAITYVCLMTRISIRAKKAPSNLMTTSLWFLVLINPEKLSSLYPPCLLALCQKRKPKFIPATLTLMANLMIMWTPLLVTALISSWKVALQHLAGARMREGVNYTPPLLSYFFLHKQDWWLFETQELLKIAKPFIQNLSES